MIIVTVELLSANTGQKQQIARMHICNDGEGSAKVGNYTGETFRGRDEIALSAGKVNRRGRVDDYRRLDLHVWNLVARMLAVMGYV